MYVEMNENDLTIFKWSVNFFLIRHPLPKCSPLKQPVLPKSVKGGAAQIHLLRRRQPCNLNIFVIMPQNSPVIVASPGHTVRPPLTHTNTMSESLTIYVYPTWAFAETEERAFQPNWADF
jgi:hypothetical protein